MKTKRMMLVLSLIFVLSCFTGCAQSTVSAATASVKSSAATSGMASAPAASVESLVYTAKVSNSDANTEWDSTATVIQLNGVSASVSGSGVVVDGGVITITQAGDYVVSGTLNNGQITIAATKSDKVHLILNGANITNKTGAPVYASQCDKLIITLAEGTQNRLTDGGADFTYADLESEEPNAALFSKDDLTVNGTGHLTVSASFNNGIGTKDDLLIVSGSITVNAANHGLRGNDSVTVVGGEITITAGADGIQTNNTEDTSLGYILITGGSFQIAAANDGIQADSVLQIDGGRFDLSAGGGWPGGSLKSTSHGTSNGTVKGTNPSDGSYKGLKSAQNIVVNSGTGTVSVYDDAIHANGSVTVNGGEFILYAGMKGIHADNTITVNGGGIDIKNCYEGMEAVFINVQDGNIRINATDDGINVNNNAGQLTISGGELYVNAEGDGLDSNGNIVMTGGTVYVDGPTTSQNGAIDCQQSFTLSGGVLVAVDIGQQPQAPGTASSQPSVVLYFNSAQKAGTEISIQSQSGATLASYTPQKSFSVIVISATGMKQGETYTLYKDVNKLCDVTVSGSVVTIDQTGAAVSGRGDFGGGMPGGMMPGGSKPGGGKR